MNSVVLAHIGFKTQDTHRPQPESDEVLHEVGSEKFVMSNHVNLDVTT